MTAGHYQLLFVLQFHIAKGNKAQRTPLPVTLVLPDHSSLLNRFQDAATKFQGTQFAYDQKDTHQINVTDPWGQRFVIVPPSDKSVFDRGIKNIPLPCAPGTAAAIGDFYEQVYKVQLVSLRLVFLVLLSLGHCIAHNVFEQQPTGSCRTRACHSLCSVLLLQTPFCKSAPLCSEFIVANQSDDVQLYLISLSLELSCINTVALLSA